MTSLKLFCSSAIWLEAALFYQGLQERTGLRIRLPRNEASQLFQLDKEETDPWCSYEADGQGWQIGVWYLSEHVARFGKPELGWERTLTVLSSHLRLQREGATSPPVSYVDREG
jgi:hypothetical protein